MLKMLRRFLARPQPARHASFEPLERRALMSAATTLEAPPASAAEDPDVTPPTVVKAQLVGPDPRNQLGVVLTFSEPLDEVSAEELDHFRIGRRTDRRQNNNSNVDDNFDDNRNRKSLIRFESAVYDPATLSVTLTARDTFNITRRFRTIRVLGREVKSVRDIAGNRLDGNNDGRPGGDSVEQYTFKRAKGVSYGEVDGDSVSLKLKGPGILWVVRNTRDGKVIGRGDALRVFIDRADPASSVLTGKVGGRGNGVAVIDELVNTSTAQVQIASDPAFQIVRSIP